MQLDMSAYQKLPVSDRLYFRIGDVAELLDLKPYVLRYWESEFPSIRPQKSSSGQRVYRRSDVDTIIMIKHLLYEEKYSIEGARKRLKELRREAALKESQSHPSAAPVLSDEFLILANQLRELSQVPIQKFFHY